MKPCLFPALFAGLPLATFHELGVLFRHSHNAPLLLPLPLWVELSLTFHTPLHHLPPGNHQGHIENGKT